MGVIKKTTWFVAMGALLHANAATAAMYKWIDEQGRVQYSQTPPPAGLFMELKPGPPPAQSPEEAEQELQARGQRLDVLQKERGAEMKAKQEKAAQQTQRDALCEQAKSRLVVLQNHPGPRSGCWGTVEWSGACPRTSDSKISPRPRRPSAICAATSLDHSGAEDSAHAPSRLVIPAATAIPTHVVASSTSLATSHVIRSEIVFHPPRAGRRASSRVVGTPQSSKYKGAAASQRRLASSINRLHKEATD